jgi:hypothetical protein
MDARDRDRDELLAGQAGSLILAGRIGDAQAACRALLNRGHERSAHGTIRTCLGRALLAAGRPRDGLRELEAAGHAGLSEAGRAQRERGPASPASRWRT